jgi:retron-type reverse transcriptase
VQAGYKWVVDVDLEKFFDRVNHDILMDRLAKRIADKRVLRLIRRYLQAGILVHGVSIERHEGTPQGGPLGPLLANVLLDEVDRELERRGHRFVRYADDCNVYVRSQRAGERVRQALRGPLREASTAGQRVEDGGGAGVGTQVPGLLLLGGTERRSPARSGRRSAGAIA